MLRALLLAAAATLPLTGAPAAHAATSADEGLAQLNAMRARLGLAVVAAHDPALDDACAKHLSYLARNGLESSPVHPEDPTRPGYTPEGDRAGRNGVLAGVWHGGQRTVEDIWGDAVYHRSVLMRPRLNAIGYAQTDDGMACLTVGDYDNARRTPTATVYPYPADGTQDVPTTFTVPEVPDPSAEVPEATGRLGYLLSGTVNGPWSSGAQVTITSASLTDEAGAPAPVHVADITSSPVLGGGDFGLFPTQPLKPAQWYTAHVEGVAVDETQSWPLSMTWRFRTRAATPDLRWGLNTQDGRGVAVASDSTAPVRVSARRAGRTLWSATLKPAGRVDQPAFAAMPAGLHGNAINLCVHQDAQAAMGTFDDCQDGVGLIAQRSRVSADRPMVVTSRLSGRRLALTMRLSAQWQGAALRTRICVRPDIMRPASRCGAWHGTRARASQTFSAAAPKLGGDLSVVFRLKTRSGATWNSAFGWQWPTLHGTGFS